jgi:hypothetical protein
MFVFIRQISALRAQSERMVELIRAGLPAGSADRVLCDKIAKRPAAIVRQVLGCASDFASRESPGFLARAYLANRIKWGLKDFGYSNEFVDSVTAGIVIAMTHAPRGSVHSTRPAKAS